MDMRHISYSKELTINLRHEEFTVGSETDGLLPVELDGRRLCLATENGRVRYREEDIADDSRRTALVLYLSKGENDSEVHIRFPAEPDEVWSAISELEHYSAASGPVEIRRVDCPIEILEQDLKRADLNSAEDIQILNALTERIDAMIQQERQLFSAVPSCECPPNLDEVLHLAGHLDRYERLTGVTTDWDLGKWAVGNKKLETDVPEAIRSFLDYSAVGREYAASHDCEFCSLGYLKNQEGDRGSPGI